MIRMCILNNLHLWNIGYVWLVLIAKSIILIVIIECWHRTHGSSRSIIVIWPIQFIVLIFIQSLRSQNSQIFLHVRILHLLLQRKTVSHGVGRIWRILESEKAILRRKVSLWHGGLWLVRCPHLRIALLVIIELPPPHNLLPLHGIHHFLWSVKFSYVCLDCLHWNLTAFFIVVDCW